MEANMTLAPEMNLAKPMNTKKINPIMIILGIVVFVLAIVSGYLFMQNMSLQKEIASLKTSQTEMTYFPSPEATSDPYASWKTYTNPNSKFSIRYPEGVEIQTYDATVDNPTNKTNLVFIGPIQKASGRTQTELFDGYVVTVTTNARTADFGDEEAANKSRLQVIDTYKDINPDCQVSELITGSIDSKPTFGYSYANCMGDGKLVMTNSGAFNFTISEGYAGDNMVNYKTIADQILSTFKFTN